MKINLGFLLSLIAFSSLTFASEYVSSPLEYAESTSKEFAEGDSGDLGGWTSCTKPVGFRKSKPRYECNGERTILVHGGARAVVEYYCNFEFRLIRAKKIYEVVDSNCY